MSLQIGLQAKADSGSHLICLGDQPQIEEGSVRSVCEAFSEKAGQLWRTKLSNEARTSPEEGAFSMGRS
ncbi:MAG: hypothetical protein IPP55_18355 [Anaerolineales bacterium]|nr:hypothetical protein [Anaerolineales bacterium]